MARTETARPYFLSGVLPGRHAGTDDDELVLLITHTDGPNLSQENGGLAILSVIDYFAKLRSQFVTPQVNRSTHSTSSSMSTAGSLPTSG